jgi:hypothetical protein
MTPDDIAFGAAEQDRRTRSLNAEAKKTGNPAPNRRFRASNPAARADPTAGHPAQKK